jgi:acyl carrier protein
MTEVWSRVNQVFQEVFGDDELAVTPETTAQDVEGWDSQMHVTLMVNIEKAFGIRFSSSEVASLKNVGQLVDLIERRLP